MLQKIWLIQREADWMQYLNKKETLQNTSDLF